MTRPKYRNPRRRRRFVREQLVWPLPEITGYQPAILSIDNVTHEATLGYRAPIVTSDTGEPPRLVPDNTPVLAIRSGFVQSTWEVDGVHGVVLSHHNGFSTSYFGLSTPLVRRGLDVRPGEVLGTLSSSVAALHFTLSRTDMVPGLPGFPRRVDPIDALLGTVRVPIEATPAPTKEAA